MKRRRSPSGILSSDCHIEEVQPIGSLCARIDEDSLMPLMRCEDLAKALVDDGVERMSWSEQDGVDV